MKILIIIAVTLVVILVLLRLFRPREIGVLTKTISIDEISEVYRQLSKQAVETSFAAFIISPPEKGPEDVVEIQFSVEEGVTGLDWKLMTEANQREKQRVIQFATSKEVEWQNREMNNWIYLRIDHGNLVELCTSLINELYQVEHVQLKYGGFVYQSSPNPE